ncbi:MAG: DinB family protein, partial [Actinomycetota bacterium]
VTLHHIFSAEERYASRFSSTEPKKWLGEIEKPSLTQLRNRAKASGNALCEAARQAKAGKVIHSVFDSKNWAINIEVLFVQVINHANEHRAQVMTTMTQIGVEPPDLSGWAWAEALKKMSVK